MGVALLALGACSDDPADDSTGGTTTSAGDALVEDTRPVEAFTRVVLVGSIDVSVDVGEAASARVRTTVGSQDDVTVRVAGDTLFVETVKGFEPPPGSLVSVAAPEVVQVSLNGAGDLAARGLAGASVIGEMAGVGSLSLAGEVDTASISVAGAGNVDASGLAAKDVTVVTIGAGNAAVRASDTLVVTIEGTGNVTYIGEPELTVDNRGTGTVTKVG